MSGKPEPLGSGLWVRRDAGPREWDEFVHSVSWATPQHSSAWCGSLSSCFGYLQVRYWLFEREGRAVGGLPLMRFRGGGPFRALYSSMFDSYGGPLIHSAHLKDEALLAALSSEIDTEAAAFGAFEARFLLPPAAPDCIDLCLQTSRCTLCPPRLCPVLNLGRPWKEIEQSYEPAVRRAIRHSARSGVSVVEQADLALTHRAYSIYSETMRRIGGITKPWRLLESFLREGLAVPFVAVRAGRPIGLVILLASSEMAIYWVSAADPVESCSRPTNALVHTALRWCHDQGIERFSFGESPGERAGLVRFKLGWGPSAAYSRTVVRIYRPLVRRGWLAMQPAARQAYTLWEKLKQTRSSLFMMSSLIADLALA